MAIKPLDRSQGNPISVDVVDIVTVFAKTKSGIKVTSHGADMADGVILPKVTPGGDGKLVESFEDPLAVRTLQEAMGRRDARLAGRLAAGIRRRQRRNGSWNALIVATAEALHQALTMPPEERQERTERLRWLIEHEDITAWLCRQLETVAELNL